MLAAALLWPTFAHAGCVWSDLVGDRTRAASVRPGPARVHFVEIAVLRPGCPSAKAACRTAAYLLPSDVVLAGHTEGAFTCAGFRAATGRSTTIGWLPTAALAPLPPSRVAVGWAGRWTAREQGLTITPAANGGLAVSGEATWGMGDPERVRRGSVHTGAVEGVARPSGGVLAFTEGEGRTLPHDAPDDGYSCRIRMVRREPYLLVRDNNRCGGVNVSFSGFYRRTAR